jgi:hypothetical protein
MLEFNKLRSHSLNKKICGICRRQNYLLNNNRK